MTQHILTACFWASYVSLVMGSFLVGFNMVEHPNTSQGVSTIIGTFLLVLGTLVLLTIGSNVMVAI